MTGFMLILTTTQPDVAELEGPHEAPVIVVGDNNGVRFGAPVYLEVEDQFGNATTSLTLDELVKLRNMLNEAIVWAEGQLAR